MSTQDNSIHEALRRERELHDLLKQQKEEQAEQRMREAVADYDAMLAAYPAQEQAEIDRFKKEQADRKQAHDDKWEAKRGALNADWAQRQQDAEKSWRGIQDDDKRAAEQKAFFDKKADDISRYDADKREADRGFAREQRGRQDTWTDRMHVARESVYDGAVATDIGEYRMELQQRDQARAQRQGQGQAAQQPTGPRPDDQPRKAGTYSVGAFGDGRNWGQMVTDAANKARNRDRAHTNSQTDLANLMKDAQDRGDFTEAKFTSLEMRRDQASYCSDVWGDVASKEFILRGETDHYREAVKNQEDAALEAHSLTGEMKQERDFAERQAQGQQNPAAIDAAQNGIAWSSDYPFGEDEAELREHSVYNALKPADRMKAEATAASREETFKAARERFEVRAAQEREAAANVTDPKEQEKREQHERKATRADMQVKRNVAEEAGQRWRHIAENEKKAYGGETAGYHDAMERAAVADAAEKDLRTRVNAQQESESEGYTAENIPGYAREAAHSAAKPQAPGTPTMTPTMQDAEKLNKGIPPQARAGHSGQQAEGPGSDRLKEMAGQAPAQQASQPEQKLEASPDAGSPRLSQFPRQQTEEKPTQSQTEAIHPDAGSPRLAHEGQKPPPQPPEQGLNKGKFQ
jgi:hypothetical protein